MENILALLLKENLHTKRDPLDPSPCDSYINRGLRDCMIVCEYTIEDLANFTNSQKTKKVMQIFEETKKREDVFKNTSVIMPLKLDNFSDYRPLQNIVLSVEENPYAFRKYVLIYTPKGIQKLVSLTENLNKHLEAILMDATNFDDFEQDKASDEFLTVQQLYVKLPFMKIRGMQSVELQDFHNPLDDPENELLVKIFNETNYLADGSYNHSPEDFVDLLLSNEKVKRFAAKDGKTL